MQIDIWSKINCPQCDKAKLLLTNRGLPFTENKIGPGAHDASELIALVPTAKSVPQIFVDGEHLGGYQQLLDLLGE